MEFYLVITLKITMKYLRLFAEASHVIMHF